MQGTAQLVERPLARHHCPRHADQCDRTSVRRSRIFHPRRDIRAPEVSGTEHLASPSVARYRCTACGNLTRFDVVSTRQTRAFHHYNMGGELSIEEEHVLRESIDEVCCRWCGSGASVEVLTEDAPA